VVLNIAERELRLEVDAMICVAPSLTSMRYSRADKETIAKVHLCSKMTTVSSSFLLLGTCLVAFIVFPCFIYTCNG